MPNTSKGHHNYSEAYRLQVVEAHQKGFTLGQISLNLKMPKSSVRNIIEAFKERGHARITETRSGRPRKTQSDVEIAKLANLGYSISEIQSDLEGRGTKISKSSIRRRIKRKSKDSVIKTLKSDSLPKEDRSTFHGEEDILSSLDPQTLKQEILRLRNLLEMKESYIEPKSIKCHFFSFRYAT